MSKSDLYTLTRSRTNYESGVADEKERRGGMGPVRTGSWTGPPRGKRAPRVRIRSSQARAGISFRNIITNLLCVPRLPTHKKRVDMLFTSSSNIGVAT